jgi:hypothetical protein
VLIGHIPLSIVIPDWPNYRRTAVCHRQGFLEAAQKAVAKKSGDES